MIRENKFVLRCEFMTFIIIIIIIISDLQWLSWSTIHCRRLSPKQNLKDGFKMLTAAKVDQFWFSHWKSSLRFHDLFWTKPYRLLICWISPKITIVWHLKFVGSQLISNTLYSLFRLFIIDGAFKGKRYLKDGNTASMLLFDHNGKVAGYQMAVC